jgi:hypothetical protein
VYPENFEFSQDLVKKYLHKFIKSSKQSGRKGRSPGAQVEEVAN